MVLFMLLGIPFFFILLAGVLRNGHSSLPEPDASPAGLFFRGLLVAVPALLALALLRGLWGVSYRPFRLYLFTLYRLHLPEFLLALAACFLFLRKEPRFLGVAYFLAGYYTLITFVDLLGSLGRPDPHHLFLLPVLRISSILFTAGLYARFREEYGWRRLLPGGLLVLVPLGAGAVSYLYRTFHRPAAVLAALGFFLGSIAFLAFYERMGAGRPARG